MIPHGRSLHTESQGPCCCPHPGWHPWCPQCLRPWPGTRATYPDQELRQDHVPLPAGQVQRRAAIAFPAGLIHLVPGAVCQQQDDRPQVFVGRGPQQVLAQGQLGAGQRGQEELLLVLGPDPPLLLFPARGRHGHGQAGQLRLRPCPGTLLTRKRGRGRQWVTSVFASVGRPGGEVHLWFTKWGNLPQAASAPRGNW